MRRKHVSQNSSGLCPRRSSSLQIGRTFSESQREWEDERLSLTEFGAGFESADSYSTP
jgi:hypothetical protein